MGMYTVSVLLKFENLTHDAAFIILDYVLRVETRLDTIWWIPATHEQDYNCPQLVWACRDKFVCQNDMDQ